MKKIITHPGSAHLDDFLSTCLVIYRNKNIECIERKSPTLEELTNPEVWVLDIGNELNPNNHNYDHHHENIEDCTLSLLLKDWGLWTKSLKVFDWLQIAVIMDTQGPKKVMSFLNISSYVLKNLSSFIEKSIIHLFEKEFIIKRGNFLFKLLNYIGEEFFRQIEEYFETLEIVNNKVKFRIIKNVPVIQCLDIKFADSLLKILSHKKSEKWGSGGIAIYPNNRPKGTIALRRYDNDERVDFRRISSMERVIFSHENGFFAALEDMHESELYQYITHAITEEQD